MDTSLCSDLSFNISPQGPKKNVSLWHLYSKATENLCKDRTTTRWHCCMGSDNSKKASSVCSGERIHLHKMCACKVSYLKSSLRMHTIGQKHNQKKKRTRYGGNKSAVDKSPLTRKHRTAYKHARRHQNFTPMYQRTVSVQKNHISNTLEVFKSLWAQP